MPRPSSLTSRMIRAASSFNPDIDVRGLGVADHVGESFLKNAKERGGEFRVQRRLLQTGRNLAANPCSGLKFLRLPFQRRGQPEVVEDAGPEFGGNSADSLYGGIDVAGKFFGSFRQVLLFRGR